ncbi:hypothetical protein HLB23_36680 [Nocardia uniformis]|uniref:Uncharacterized protein n=1 Tax=Nocardia uniformis TaxID=53432 RepID=A0A849CBU6_9NOCA|nr:hypothetical protein [Nocardia uniformis]NNH75326.1 hypothetical protein [Nocardia uniformis]
MARQRAESAGWFIALTADVEWRAAGRMPPVWEYLTNPPTILAATGSPELRRFLGGLWAWPGGSRA